MKIFGCMDTVKKASGQAHAVTGTFLYEGVLIGP